MNRVSMGVQQLDDELIKASGRRQRADQVFRTLDSCRQLDLPISVDLIFGWPNQTIDQMVRDLEAIAATGVGHITHYELNVAGRTDFARNRRGELPSQEENLEMYRVGKSVLEARGYTQVTAYDFARRDAAMPSSYLYEELFRKPFASNGTGPIGCDAWGWGYAGISFFFGTPQFARVGVHEPGAGGRVLPVHPRATLSGDAGLPLHAGRPAAAPALPGDAGALGRSGPPIATCSAATSSTSTRVVWRALEDIAWVGDHGRRRARAGRRRLLSAADPEHASPTTGSRKCADNGRRA